MTLVGAHLNTRCCVLKLTLLNTTHFALWNIYTELPVAVSRQNKTTASFEEEVECIDEVANTSYRYFVSVEGVLSFFGVARTLLFFSGTTSWKRGEGQSGLRSEHQKRAPSAYSTLCV